MKWIKCSERLPEPGTEVLVYVKCAYDTSILHYNVYVYDPAMYQPHWTYVTHWMPLPEPPRNGGEE